MLPEPLIRLMQWSYWTAAVISACLLVCLIVLTILNERKP